jgi:hypothetical protein
VLIPAVLPAQSPTTQSAPDGVMLAFQRFADIYGGWLVAAFDSIPESRYDYRPMPVQRSIGNMAQHLENANYALCERLGTTKHARTAKDSLSDSVKSRWPKDTLVARLKASLDFCDKAMEQAGPLESGALASTLLGFETDLAEHYSQLATYMRLLDMVPPSALPPKKRTAVDLPASALSAYVGVYQLSPSVGFQVTVENGALFITPNTGGPTVRLWPESNADFFVQEVDAQVTFTRDASGRVRGFVLHQYGRERPATKVK